MDTSYITEGTCLDANGETGRLQVRMDYDSDSPYEVLFTFCNTDGSTPRRWTFSRDLLKQGLTTTASKPAGTGDVKCGMSGKDFVVILDSPWGHAEIAVQHQEIQLFVNNAYAIVPEGTEHVPFDLDAELEKLLEGK